MKTRFRFPDSFLKAFDAHDTEPDAAVKMVGSVRRNNNDDGGTMKMQRDVDRSDTRFARDLK
jgi:hypothetical protein